MLGSELLVDLDGVLVNFVYGALKFHDRLDIPYDEITWDFDLTVRPDGREHFWAPLGFEFWANLPWTPNGQSLIDRLLRRYGAEKICVCTSPCATIGSIEGKIEWIRREIPELKRNFMICPVKQFAAGPKRILIDDNDGNCEKFRAGGGKAVMPEQPWNKLSNLHIKGLGGAFNIDRIIGEVESLWS